MNIPVDTPQDRWYAVDRLAGLKRFALTLTLFTVLGHLFLGFEQSWAQPLVALAAAYIMQILLELVEARVQNRPVCFIGGGPRRVFEFLLSAHIPALACAMLLYSNDRLMPIAFAAVVAIGSKAVFRIPKAGGTIHFLNPSNFGIALTLLLFPSVGIAPPYHFTESISGWGNWALPALIIVLGTLINYRFTDRMTLMGAWLCGFFAQAVARSFVFGTPLVAALLPATGLAFLLFTFYMITDPPTSPASKRGQMVFGLSVAAAYGLLVTCHVVFGLFFGLTIVCALRGSLLLVLHLARRQDLAATSSTSAVPAAHSTRPVQEVVAAGRSKR